MAADGDLSRGEWLLIEQPAVNPWRIERDAKLFFCVVRNGEEGREFVRSASGRVSSFRTYKAAQRARAAIALATGNAS